jgi:hypothetical protein
MVQRIAEDGVTRSDQGLDRTDVCGVSGGEERRGRSAEEMCEGDFGFAMRIHGSGD